MVSQNIKLSIRTVVEVNGKSHNGNSSFSAAVN